VAKHVCRLAQSSGLQHGSVRAEQNQQILGMVEVRGQRVLFDHPQILSEVTVKTEQTVFSDNLQTA